VTRDIDVDDWYDEWDDTTPEDRDWVVGAEDLQVLYRAGVGIPDMPTCLRLAKENERLKRELELAKEAAHYDVVARMFEGGL
jgi:hypothetical protein